MFDIQSKYKKLILKIYQWNQLSTFPFYVDRALTELVQML